MHRLLSITLLALLLTACSSSEAWDSLPSAITDFITQYYPGSTVSDYNEYDNGSIRVKIDNGATLIFDSDLQWTEIDGNGVPLPEVLVYDQFPPDLFEFLQATSQQREVFAVNRDRKYYKLTMHDTVLTYDIQSGRVTYPGQAPDS